MDFQGAFDNSHAEIIVTRNRLPHWHRANAIHFITFRLADSLPQKLLREWEREEKAWLHWNPPPWSREVRLEFWECFEKRKHDLLDQGVGSCIFRNIHFREVLADVMVYHETNNFRHVSWVIMPNHLHILTQFLEQNRPSRSVASWKKESAREINRLLGKEGKLWEKDYYDTMMRDREHLHNCIRYIRRNPEKAKLAGEEYMQFESEYAKSVM